MSLTQAIAFLKDAADRTGSGVAQYIFSDGFCYARSPAIVACHPIDLDGTFALPADDLDKALARLDGEPEIGAGEGTIILKKGRLRSSLKVLEAEAPHTPEHIDWQPVPQGFNAALKLAVPFISEEGTWQRGVRLSLGRLSAINNRSAVHVALDTLPKMDAILSDDAARYVASLPDPVGWIVAPSAIAFNWTNGAWVRCQLVNANWPDVADRVIADATRDTPVDIADEWREAVEHIAFLGDGIVRVAPDGIRGARNHSDSDVLFETGATRTTSWAADALKIVFVAATMWNPDADSAARFVGVGIEGVVMRRRN